MAARNGEITLRDLLSWEPHLHLLAHGQQAGDEDPLDRDVEWVVTARTGAPMLPQLRGGELVLMPHRIVAESGVPLGMLLAELAGQPVAGVVIDHPATAPTGTVMPILGVPTIASELESDLNRLLTSRRGDLLRTGADVERTIAELTARDARPGELIETLSTRLGLGITVTTSTGAILFSTTEQAESRPNQPEYPGQGGGEWIRQPLLGQRMLWIGPVAPNQRALGRIVIRRLRDGVQRSLDQADATAPHGSARIQALNALLQPGPGSSPEQLAANALRAGVPAGAQLRVALFRPGDRDQEVRRRLASFGALNDAGTIDGLTAQLIIIQESRARTILVSQPGLDGVSSIAISAAIPSARQLPEAVRQVRYIAGLQQRGMLSKPEVQFDDDVVLGAFRLLYDQWGTQQQHRYIDHIVGDLLREDRRGQLRETLRVYLEYGGAQRPTSEKLGIHRNTLTYRMRQIREMLSLDPDDPTGRLGLHLALLGAELPPAPPQLP
jgi:hypothetical protein